MLTVFVKCFVSDAWQDSEYVSGRGFYLFHSMTNRLTKSINLKMSMHAYIKKDKTKLDNLIASVDL